MTGYCTVDDVRRVLQEAELSQALQANNSQIVVDAIEGLAQWLEKATKKHWYESGGISEDDANVVDTAAKTRDDEYSLPTHGGYVAGAYDSQPDRWTTTTGTVFDVRTDEPDPKEQIRLAFGDLDDDTIPAYTRIRLDRKDVSAVNSLNVVNKDGGYDDWTGADFSGGVGTSSRGDDWWVRENNAGWSELYLDVHTLDDDIVSLRNAVYVDYDYGEDGLDQTVRRGVAQLAASELVTDDEFQTSLPDQGQLVSIETKAQRWERQGLRKLSHHFERSLEDIELP